VRVSQVQSFNLPLDPPDLSGLSPAEIARFSQVLERWRTEPAALLTMLFDLQEIWGYLPQRALEHVSHVLRIPRVDLFALREFFDLLHEAPPRRVLGLCANAPCAARGGVQVAALLRRAADRRPDLGLHIADVPCQGCCDLAPVAVLDGWPRRLTPPVARRLAQALLEGRLDLGPAPERGGRVRPTPTRVAYRNLHRPAAHRLPVSRAHGGYAMLEQIVRTWSPEAAIRAIAESGLLGAGGQRGHRRNQNSRTAPP